MMAQSQAVTPPEQAEALRSSSFSSERSRAIVTDAVKLGDGNREGLVAGHSGVVGEPEECPAAVDRKTDVAGMLD